ncbi:hypothetical protein DDZ13_09545 [Coraliomargarita sinensis]|uniref:Uncharacterized protein n=1 Tax=Coraliomargarita sinensis TaxID=2174842 RepID=A0A317ZEI9_9BACT|nr:hypothetical protein [Coraliomargarita sinensis]PXA03874.1 hypothetical protein DDZ13_09545 [Coraliomargarita sinensis]
MKEINIAISRLNEATLLSHRISKLELYQLGKVTFIIREPVDDKIVYAFTSPALGRFLTTSQTSDIREVQLVVEETMPDLDGRNKLLKLTLSTREIVSIDEDDFICKSQPLHPRPLEYTGRLLTPYQLWGGDPLSYLSLILVSDRLVDSIEDIALDGNQLELLDVMWREYQRDLKAGRISLKERHIIYGEFLEFTAKRIGGFVVLDL